MSTHQTSRHRRADQIRRRGCFYSPCVGAESPVLSARDESAIPLPEVSVTVPALESGAVLMPGVHGGARHDRDVSRFRSWGRVTD